MAKTIPMIITNKNILLRVKDGNEFATFEMPGIEEDINIPFYHQFAGKIAECQHYFKEFVQSQYGKRLSKYILAIVVPDDTSPLERIFINEFFLNSGACKGVAQITMGQALSKEHKKYVSVSMSTRNVTLLYVSNGEIKVRKYYDVNEYNPHQISEDAKRLHIDVEYEQVPVFINNFNMNMDAFAEVGQFVSPKEFLDKISVIDVEKV